MKIIVDVNLAVRWAPMLSERGIETVHWTTIGDAAAPDSEIMLYAKTHGYSIFTNDLDFSAILVSTRASGPSVIQIRDDDTRPEGHLERVVNVFHKFSDYIEQGSLITINPNKTRLHILPFSFPKKNEDA